MEHLLRTPGVEVMKTSYQQAFGGEAKMYHPGVPGHSPRAAPPAARGPRVDARAGRAPSPPVFAPRVHRSPVATGPRARRAIKSSEGRSRSPIVASAAVTPLPMLGSSGGLGGSETPMRLDRLERAIRRISSDVDGVGARMHDAERDVHDLRARAGDSSSLAEALHRMQLEARSREENAARLADELARVKRGAVDNSARMHDLAERVAALQAAAAAKSRAAPPHAGTAALEETVAQLRGVVSRLGATLDGERSARSALEAALARSREDAAAMEARLLARMQSEMHSLASGLSSASGSAELDAHAREEAVAAGVKTVRSEVSVMERRMETMERRLLDELTRRHGDAMTALHGEREAREDALAAAAQQMSRLAAAGSESGTAAATASLEALTAVQRDLTEVQLQVTDLGRQMGEMESVLRAEIQARMKGDEKLKSALAKQQSACEAAVDELRRQLASLSERSDGGVKNLTATSALLTTKVDAALSELDGRWQMLLARVSEHSDTLAAHDSNVEAMQRELARVEAMRSKMPSGSDSAALAELRSHLELLISTEVNERREGVDSLRRSLTKVADDARSHLEEWVAILQERIAGLLMASAADSGGAASGGSGGSSGAPAGMDHVALLQLLRSELDRDRQQLQALVEQRVKMEMTTVSEQLSLSVTAVFDGRQDELAARVALVEAALKALGERPPRDCQGCVSIDTLTALKQRNDAALAEAVAALRAERSPALAPPAEETKPREADVATAKTPTAPKSAAPPRPRRRKKKQKKQPSSPPPPEEVEEAEEEEFFSAASSAARNGRSVKLQAVKRRTTVKKTIKKTVSAPAAPLVRPPPPPPPPPAVDKDAAAVKLQAAWRGHAARKDDELARRRAAREQAAAVRLQAAWRGYMVRRRDPVGTERARRQRAAAVRLQAAWRGHDARRRALPAARQRQAAREGAAARTLQRVWRGHAVRKADALGARRRELEEEAAARAALAAAAAEDAAAAAAAEAAARAEAEAAEAAARQLVASKLQAQWRGARVRASDPLGKLRAEREAREQAAKVVQAAYRASRDRARQREQQSAAIIQSAWRGLQGRRRAARRLKAILTLQALHRGHSVRGRLAAEEAAATKLQAMLRGGMARSKLAAKKRAARQLQRRWRWYLATRRLARFRITVLNNLARDVDVRIIQRSYRKWRAARLGKAATSIQRRVRGMQARHAVELMRAERLQRAVVMMQKMYRGHVARKRVREMRGLPSVSSSASLTRGRSRRRRKKRDRRRRRPSSSASSLFGGASSEGGKSAEADGDDEDIDLEESMTAEEVAAEDAADRARNADHPALSEGNCLRLMPVIAYFHPGKGAIIPEPAGIDKGAGRWSLAFWIYPTEQVLRGAGVWRTLLIKGNDYKEQRMPGVFLHYKKLQFGLCCSTPGAWRKTVLSPTRLLPHMWTHVCITFKKDEFHLYLNGSIDSTVHFPGKLLHNDQPFCLNKPPHGTKRDVHDYPGFAGYVEDLRFYYRALPFQEVWELARPRVWSRIDTRHPVPIEQLDMDYEPVAVERPKQDIMDIVRLGLARKRARPWEYPLSLVDKLRAARAEQARLRGRPNPLEALLRRTEERYLDAPHNVENMTQLALQLHLLEHNYFVARAMYRIILYHRPNTATVLYNFAVLTYINLGRDYDVEWMVNRAKLLDRNLRKLRSCLQWYELAVRTWPRSGQALLNAGCMLFLLKQRYAPAEKYLRAACDASPSSGNIKLAWKRYNVQVKPMLEEVLPPPTIAERKDADGDFYDYDEDDDDAAAGGAASGRAGAASRRGSTASIPDLVPGLPALAVPHAGPPRLGDKRQRGGPRYRKAKLSRAEIARRMGLASQARKW